MVVVRRSRGLASSQRRPKGRRPAADHIPYTIRLHNGRTVFVELSARFAVRDRSGELAFTPEGVRFLDRLRALADEPPQSPTPAYLVALRQALGLTQAELGRLIGRSKMTVSRWECGSMRPSSAALERLYALARKRKAEGIILAE